MTSNHEILKYYNTHAGRDPAEPKNDDEYDNYKTDKFNNPEGQQFDLGIDQAFDDFRILIGNFFQRKGEFRTTDFE